MKNLKVSLTIVLLLTVPVLGQNIYPNGKQPLTFRDNSVDLGSSANSQSGLSGNLEVQPAENIFDDSGTSERSYSSNQAVKLVVPDGTELEVELMRMLSSKTAKVGDSVEFAVTRPVLVGNTIVIARGAPARGHVVAVKKKGFWGRRGKIEIGVQDVLTVDGNRISLRGQKHAEGGGNVGKVAIAVVVSALLFWPVAPLWGLVKGKDIELPAGTRAAAFVHGDSEITGRSVE